MEHKRIGFVVAHAAHLLTVAGMVMRWRPQVLILTKASQGAGVGQADLICSGLRMIGLDGQVSLLDMDESESYREALRGNFDFHAQAVPQIVDWLKRTAVDVVFGDAFEASNYQHDLGCVMLTEALRQCHVQSRRIERFEFPLSCQVSQPEAVLQYGVFPLGSHETFQLNDNELQKKKLMVDWAGGENEFVAHVAPQFPQDSAEIYRAVAADRDYLQPPTELARYYDARGLEEVAAGRYSQAISFDRHFRPAVQAICGRNAE